MDKVDKRLVWGAVVIGVITVAVILMFATGRFGPGNQTARLWLAGAMALGLAVGLTTGMSTSAGISAEFIKFVSAGVVIPVLGGIGAFLARREEVVERFRYEEAQLVEQSTITATVFTDELLHPFAVLGLFFAGFGLCAVVGIAVGRLLREAGIEIKLG